MKSNKVMKKQMVKKEVFYKQSNHKPIRLTKEILEQLQEGDIIFADYDEGFVSENNAMDSHFYFKIIREREETDKEFENRKQAWEAQQKMSKQMRYQSYLKLKKEFEDEV